MPSPASYCPAEHHLAGDGKTMYACVLEPGHDGQHRDQLGRLWVNWSIHA